MKQKNHNFVFSIRNFIKLELGQAETSTPMNISLDNAIKSHGKLFSYRKVASTFQKE